MSGYDVPEWDLSPVYPGFDSLEYREAKESLLAKTDALKNHLGGNPGTDYPAWLKQAMVLISGTGSTAATLSAYASAIYTVDTRDARAVAEMNAIDELLLPLHSCDVAFRNVIASRKAETATLSSTDPDLKPFAFYLEEETFWQGKQMSPELEDLAEDLNRSGGEAWGRLQGTISSIADIVWDEKTGERKTAVELRNFAFHEDRSVRRRAFEKELEVWKAMEAPLAAALNGVKGFTRTLNKRRGWDAAIDKSVRQARISRKTLDALVEAMKDFQPVFRRYLKAKAKLLGVEKCAFYDLFAPVGGASKAHTWDDARKIITGTFSTFSPEMGEFSEKAFAERWIDAPSHEGKVGGAYCTDFPDSGVCRILCNFEGSFNSVTTVAHELGHAYHGEVMHGLPFLQTQYPMTLAETASIFAETVVFENALASCGGTEKLGLLEAHLQDGCQIIVDILSRYLFETEVFARREKGELSPGELCDIMIRAQKETYGDALDENALHPYMWAAKSHYYSTGLSFYNFPYAFGQLFGLGLYARYRKEGPGFAKTYRDILRETGRASAVDIAKGAGFDIESVDFWKEGLSVFSGQVEEFEGLAGR